MWTLGKWLLVASLAVALGGCGGSHAATRSTAPTRHADVAAPVNGCPNSEGGDCRGRLAAGTYNTVVFAPALTYTVPKGWQNFEDTPGNFLLVPPGQSLHGVNANTSDFIGVYTAVAAVKQRCGDTRAPGVGVTPSAIARFLTGLPGINPATPRPVDVGGLRGLVVDLSMQESWKKTCPVLPGTPLIGLIVGRPPSGLYHGLEPWMAWRLYLLRYRRGALAIEVDDTSGGKRLNDYAAVVKQFAFAH
jgi:hypothetical protein